MSLKKFFKSEIHKKIILFFKENPSSIDTPRGVAAWVGTNREKAKKVLDELEQAGVLTAIETTSTSGYSFTQDKKIIKQVKDLTKDLA